MSEFHFLGFEFADLRLEHNRLLTRILRRHPQPLSGYTFPTLAAWRPYFLYRWAAVEPGTLLISCILDPDPNPHLLQPVGPLSPALTEKIIGEAAGLPYALKIIGVSRQFLEDNPVLSRSFESREDRAVSNYLYSAGALAKLAGRKYSKKRNLLSQASGLYSWKVHPLTPENADACFRVLDSIAREEQPRLHGMLARELAALECTLRHFAEFSQQGVLLTVDERPVAFSIYEPIGPTTVAVHFERALRSYKGLYQVINWETAKVVADQGFEFINREEDVGDEGLRKAKMSYNPVEIVPAYEMVYQSHPS